jgi:hypothetical protein
MSTTVLPIVEVHAGALERAGLIPGFLDPDDPRPAAGQFGENYAGGWHPMKGWELDTGTWRLTFPGDCSLVPYLLIRLRDEMVFVYPFSWVLVFDTATGAWQVARLD